MRMSPVQPPVRSASFLPMSWGGQNGCQGNKWAYKAAVFGKLISTLLGEPSNAWLQLSFRVPYQPLRGLGNAAAMYVHIHTGLGLIGLLKSGTCAQVVGEGRCPIVDTWWQTETGAAMITPLPGAWAALPGSATLPFFGVAPVLLDDKVRGLRHSALLRCCTPLARRQGEGALPHTPSLVLHPSCSTTR